MLQYCQAPPFKNAEPEKGEKVFQFDKATLAAYNTEAWATVEKNPNCKGYLDWCDKTGGMACTAFNNVTAKVYCGDDDKHKTAPPDATKCTFSKETDSWGCGIGWLDADSKANPINCCRDANNKLGSTCTSSVIQTHFSCNPISCSVSGLAATLWSSNQDTLTQDNSFYASEGAGSLACATKTSPTWIIIGSVAGCFLLCFLGKKWMSRNEHGGGGKGGGGGNDAENGGGDYSAISAT